MDSHVVRGEDSYVGKRMMRMEIEGNRKRARARRRWAGTLRTRICGRNGRRIETNGGSSSILYEDGRSKIRQTLCRHITAGKGFISPRYH